MHNLIEINIQNIYIKTTEGKTICYSALVGEYLRIGRSTLKTDHFTPKAGKLLQLMISQGAGVSVSKKMISKIMSVHPEDFIGSSNVNS